MTDKKMIGAFEGSINYRKFESSTVYMDENLGGTIDASNAFNRKTPFVEKDIAFMSPSAIGGGSVPYTNPFDVGRGTETGDLIALDTESSDEKYVLANDHTFNRVVGVHSDSYGHLIGGVRPNSDADFLQYNLPKYIPVGLSGRVKTKVIGTCKKGDYLVASNIDGVARKYNKETDDSLLVFGIACENKVDSEIERIRVYLK